MGGGSLHFRLLLHNHLSVFFIISDFLMVCSHDNVCLGWPAVDGIVCCDEVRYSGIFFKEC